MEAIDTNLNDRELEMLIKNDFSWAVRYYAKRVGCDKKAARDKVLEVYFDLHGIENTAKYVGCIETDQLPFQKGDEVIIPKGVNIRTMEPSKNGHKVSGRKHKVKVHHTLSGVDPHRSWHDGSQVHPSNPSICWAGPGGYWCEVDVNDILESNGK